MGNYKLSEACKIDIDEIYEYGIKNFGLAQAQNYLLELHELFFTLADNVNIGRDASEFFPLLKRFTYKSHMIFYLQKNSETLIVRVLSQSMDYQLHFN